MARCSKCGEDSNKPAGFMIVKSNVCLCMAPAGLDKKENKAWWKQEPKNRHNPAQTDCPFGQKQVDYTRKCLQDHKAKAEASSQLSGWDTSSSSANTTPEKKRSSKGSTGKSDSGSKR